MKLAFVHIPKTAGTFARVYIDELLEKLGCGRTIFDARYPANHQEVIEDRFRHIPGFIRAGSDTSAASVGRCEGCYQDWTNSQMEYILDYEPAVGNPHSFIHNHSPNWSHDLFAAYKKGGWKTFAFVRSLGEVMCSYHAFIKNQFLMEGGPNKNVLCDEFNLNVWGAPYSVIHKITLDEFLQIMLKHMQNMDANLYYIPSYWEELDFVAPYSDDNFAVFLKKYLGHEFEGCIPGDAKNLTDRNKAKLLESGNKGYQYHCERGEISRKTQDMIANNYKQKVYEEICRGGRD